MVTTVASDHYFESHVTIEPVFGERLTQFALIAKGAGFRVAELLLQKERADTPERSSKDSFCTGRSKDFADLHRRMESLVEELRFAEFEVWRYKIESTLLDVRVER